MKTIYPRLSSEFFKDFWRILKPYWQSADKKKGYLYLIINLFCSLGGVFASVQLNNVTKVMFDALSNFNKPLLIQSSVYFLGLAVIIFFSAGYGAYFTGLLSMRWQKWLTHHTLEIWLSQHQHFKLNWLHQGIDNPDQRITEDLAAFPALTLKIFFTVLHSASTFISFSVILWGLSSHFPLMIGRYQLMIPGYLFFSAGLYGVLGLWLIGVIGRRLSALEYRQQLFNANFRAHLLRIREFGEQISLYRGEQAEKQQLFGLFSKIYDNFLQANYLRKNLMFFTIGFEILTQIVGIFLAIPLFFAKKVQYGGMMQISGAFVSVVRAFSNMMDVFSSVAELKAVVYRLTELTTSLANTERFLQEDFHVSIVQYAQLTVKDMLIEHYDGRLMQKIKYLHFEAPQRYLISGVSGSGKTTFIKSLIGLWPYVTGRISRPELSDIFLVPQRSYLPHGTLRAVLSYPATSIPDARLQELLHLVGLHDFSGQLDQNANWSQIFSLGQQQLIGFVRLFLAQPKIIILDEATSALDEDNQRDMYQLIHRFFPKACTISIGHRQSLKAFHHQLIVLSSTEHMVLG